MRNQNCQCGSNRRYKHCCGRIPSGKLHYVNFKISPANETIQEQHLLALSREKLRNLVVGYSRPVVHFRQHGITNVVVGNRLMWSDKWLTFHDFLLDYLKEFMGREWGTSQLQKAKSQQHPLIQWYVSFTDQQGATFNPKLTVQTTPKSGVGAAFLRFAYNLFLLENNCENGMEKTKLFRALVKRLKHPDQFAGAYYELDVFGMLIAAGMKLTLENEKSATKKICEATIFDPLSGQKFSVEAKAIHRKGILGVGDEHGSSQTSIQKNIIRLMRKALAKSSDQNRIIFIDLNDGTDQNDTMPTWFQQAIETLSTAKFKIEGELADPAIVILTNRVDHLSGNSTNYRYDHAVANYQGHRMRFPSTKTERTPDENLRVLNEFVIGLHSRFNRNIYPPSTFDGSLPSQTIDNGCHEIYRGLEHFISTVDGEKFKATVLDAWIDMLEKKLVVELNTGQTLVSKVDPKLANEYYLFGPEMFC